MKNIIQTIAALLFIDCRW